MKYVGTKTRFRLDHTRTGKTARRVTVPMTVSTQTQPAGIPRPAKPTRPLSTRGTHTHQHPQTPPNSVSGIAGTDCSLIHALCTLSLGMAVLPLADGAL
jgi:hypothetical protein